jgi:hypothetical protein
MLTRRIEPARRGIPVIKKAPDLRLLCVQLPELRQHARDEADLVVIDDLRSAALRGDDIEEERRELAKELGVSEPFTSLAPSADIPSSINPNMLPLHGHSLAAHYTCPLRRCSRRPLAVPGKPPAVCEIAGEPLITDEPGAGPA